MGTKAPWWLSLVLAGLSLLGTAYMQFTHSDYENAARITKVEVRQDSDAARLDRIEQKLDRLIEWAIGPRH